MKPIQFFHANNFQAGAPPAGLVFDTYLGIAGYSLRKLKTGATVAVRVRRSSDNAEQDIGFSGDDFDVSAFSSFIGGGNGFVTTWYDQSGNSNHITQTTNANQPQLILSHYGSIPALSFDGAGDSFDIATFLTSATAASLYMVNNLVLDPPTDTNKVGHLISARQTSYSYYPYTDGVVYDEFGASPRHTVGNPTPSLSTKHLYCVITAAADWRAYINNTSIHSSGSNTVAWGSYFIVGRQFYSSSLVPAYNGYAPEILIYDSAHSDTDRDAVAANINSYFSVY